MTRAEPLPYLYGVCSSCSSVRGGAKRRKEQVETPSDDRRSGDGVVIGHGPEVRTGHLAGVQ